MGLLVVLVTSEKPPQLYRDNETLRPRKDRTETPVMESVGVWNPEYRWANQRR